jgi:hypothetical protein
MNRRREAKRKLDDGDDADLADRRADLGSKGSMLREAAKRARD